MDYVLDHGKPHHKFFEEISRIPRMSFREQSVSDYIVSFAEARGLWYDQDKLGNVIVKKPANPMNTAPGFDCSDHAEPIMLQAHLDMVCEKDPELSFDFASESIRLVVKDGWAKAQGTTLGADDGAGVALMLAVLDDRSLVHPPLECVFTVQEEDGMGGALHLDYSKLSAKRLIALDGLEEGTTIISTTGISCGHIIKACPRRLEQDLTSYDMANRSVGTREDCTVYSLKVSGLRGGHAALNIGKGQGNAIKIAAELLYEICGRTPASGSTDEYSLNLISIEGGTILNGIPRECDAYFTYTGDPDKFVSIIKMKTDELRLLLREADPDLVVTVDIASPSTAPQPNISPSTAQSPIAVESPFRVMDSAATKEVLGLIRALPVGVKEWSKDIPDFPVASWNLGTVDTAWNTDAGESCSVRIGYACRSVSTEQVDEMAEEAIKTAAHHHAAYQEKFRYGGYTVDEHSPLIDLWADVYKGETGKELQLRRIHSGTDAGTIAENMGGMDIIVLMPNTENVHTPAERMELASFDRTCRYLFKILERC